MIASGAVVASLLASGPVQAEPAAGSVQQVYHGGTATTPSVAVTDYTGEPLTVQMSYVGNTAAEPTLGVANDGTGYYASSRLDVDTPVTWGIAATDIYRTDDGGLTWHSVGFKLPTGHSSPPANADPLMYLDTDTGRVFDVSLMAACLWVNWSDDKGASWSTNPLSCDSPPVDHQTFVAAHPRGQTLTSSYPNLLMFCTNQLESSECTRSLDGGASWKTTPNPPYPTLDGPINTDQCGALTGHLGTDSEGRIFLPRGGCNHPWIAITEDGGDSWKQVQVSSMTLSVQQDGEITHTSVTSDSAGNLYYAWVSPVGDPNNPTAVAPFMAVSRDHGNTWSSPINVAPPGVKWANFPVVSAGDEGRVALNFPGSTSSTRASTHTLWNQYLVITTDALDPNPLFLSATGNDPVTNPVHRGTCFGRCDGMWDFIDVQVSAQGQAWGAGSDDCTGVCNAKNAASAHNGDGFVIRQIGGPHLRG